MNHADMPLLPNVQRIVARGPGTLSKYVVVDVGGILRWIHECHADPSRVWPLLDEALLRSGREIMWIIAPCAPSCEDVTPADLDREHQRILGVHAASSVIRTAYPLLASIRERLAIPDRISVITAGIDDRVYHLQPLDQDVDQMLDIASGKTWSRPMSHARELEPAAQPMLSVLVGAEPGEKGLTRDARKYQRELQDFVLGEKELDELGLPRWLNGKLRSDDAQIENRADALRGGPQADTNTIAQLASWVQSTATIPHSTYILPFFGERGQLQMLHVTSTRHSFFTFGDYMERHLRELHQDNPDRWFVPHGLDLCGWMYERGLPLPRSVVDPAMAAFILNPDHPIDLVDTCPTAVGCSEEVGAWLGDIERELSMPEQGGQDIIALLPGIDRDLSAQLQGENLYSVMEEDIGPTIPVLAKIERRGAWVEVPPGYATWSAVQDKLLRRLRFHEKTVREYLPWIDPYTTDNSVLVNLLLTHTAMLLPRYWPAERKRGELFDRFIHAGVPVALAIRRARTIASSLEWVTTLAEAGGRLRGRLVPQKTGRFGYRDEPLQNMPKNSIEGRLLRSALRAPPGYRLFSCDYDSFEGRLLAALSGDPALLASARQRDMHLANARLLFQLSTPEIRSRTKAALYAIGYGQQKDGFMRNQTDLAIEEAGDCFDAVVRGFPVLMQYQQRAIALFRKTRAVTSSGGWRRHPGDWRKAVNTEIQALAATIFRRVLRELDIRLTPLGAFVLAQVHDEVLVAAPPETVSMAKSVVTTVLENAAILPSSLLPHPVPLFTKLHEGETWADL